jgi:hypothetical protein
MYIILLYMVKLWFCKHSFRDCRLSFCGLRFSARRLLIQQPHYSRYHRLRVRACTRGSNWARLRHRLCAVIMLFINVKSYPCVILHYGAICGELLKLTAVRIPNIVANFECHSTQYGVSRNYYRLPYNAVYICIGMYICTHTIICLLLVVL